MVLCTWICWLLVILIFVLLQENVKLHLWNIFSSDSLACEDSSKFTVMDYLSRHWIILLLYVWYLMNSWIRKKVFHFLCCPGQKWKSNKMMRKMEQRDSKMVIKMFSMWLFILCCCQTAKNKQRGFTVWTAYYSNVYSRIIAM